MKQKNLIALKAFFLLFVFCMNTVVCFACAFGARMEYNENHHQEVLLNTPPEHKHEHANNAKHEHSKTDASHSKNKAGDDCCKNEAKKFGEFNKIVNKISFDLHQPVFFLSYFQSFHSFDLHNSAQLISLKRNLYQSHHPPISNRQIANQTFLI